MMRVMLNSKGVRCTIDVVRSQSVRCNVCCVWMECCACVGGVGCVHVMVCGRIDVCLCVSIEVWAAYLRIVCVHPYCVCLLSTKPLCMHRCMYISFLRVCVYACMRVCACAYVGGSVRECACARVRVFVAWVCMCVCSASRTSPRGEILFVCVRGCVCMCMCA